MAGSVNKVILVGNLGKDPEVRRMQSGDAVVNLSVATSETWRDKASGERKEKTEWHRVVNFNKNLAEVAEKYLRKGSKVFLEGSLQTRKWTDKDGAEKYSTEVVLQNFRGELVMLDTRGEGGSAMTRSGGAAARRANLPAILTAAKWMTRYRFSSGVNFGIPCLAALALALGLGGCAIGSSGEAATGFFTPEIGAAFIPLHMASVFTDPYAAAVVIAPGVAVTNAHNSNLLDPKQVIGKVEGYDLLYFRTSKTATLPVATATDGEEVIAYGQGTDGGLRSARGVVNQFWPAAFGYMADAGPGFSGGPVVDAKTGALVGITYGYIDKDGNRQMVAYKMAFVMDRLAALHAAAAPH